MLMRPLINPTAMKACQQAARASRNSVVAAGRGPERAELVKAINPRFRSSGYQLLGRLTCASRCGALRSRKLTNLRFRPYYHGSIRARLTDCPSALVIFCGSASGPACSTGAGAEQVNHLILRQNFEGGGMV